MRCTWPAVYAVTMVGDCVKCIVMQVLTSRIAHQQCARDDGSLSDGQSKHFKTLVIEVIFSKLCVHSWREAS